MNILVVLVDILCTYNEIFWMYRWVNFFLEKKISILRIGSGSRDVEKILKLLYVITVYCMNRIELTSAYTMVVIMLMNYIAVQYFWKSNLAQTSAVVGGYFFVLFLVGNIVISITGILGGDELILKSTGEMGVVRLIYLIFNGLLWYILNNCGLSYIRKKRAKIKNMKSLAFMSIIGFIGSAFLGMMLVNSFTIRIGMVWYVFLLIVLFFLFGSYFVMSQKDIKSKMVILATKNDMLERNYIQLNEFYTANAKLYHDMNHHFEVIYHLLQNGDMGKAESYLKKLCKSADYIKIRVKSGISVLDAVLYEMEKKAHEKGVEFDMEISLLPSDLGFENSDICSLFANLLENAIEASVKKVSIQIKKINQTLLVVVENDYVIKPVIREGRLVSIKKDKIIHGWGTQIIEQIVHKYEGSIEYDIKTDQFIVSIMLNEMLDE